MDEMPKAYKQAVLAVEDKRFYRHPGMDPIAIGRAIIHDIQAGAYVEGGSTITQQLAKNQFFTQTKRWCGKVSSCLWHSISRGRSTKIRSWNCISIRFILETGIIV